MKTAPEVLLEEKIDRMQREATDRNWAGMVNRCRPARGRMPFVAQFVLAVVLVGIFSSISQPGDYRGLFISAGIFLLVCVPAHLIEQRRREKGLLAIIEQEAPQLYRKLKHESLA